MSESPRRADPGAAPDPRASADPRPSATEMAYWFSQMAAPGLLEVMGLEELLGG